MSVRDDFFNSAYRANKGNDSLLIVEMRDRNEYAVCYYYFDFKTRVVMTKDQQLRAFSSIPFSQMDSDVLERHWQKLKDLGGDPPPLTPGLRKSIVSRPEPPDMLG